MLQSSRKILILSICVPVFAALLACSPRQKAKSEAVTISLWQFWTDPQVKPVLIDLLAGFEQNNPGIKVETTDLTWSNGHDKIVVAYASNSAPDVLELGSDWVPEFAHQGVLHDMTAEVDSVRPSYRMWEPAIKDNRIFGFPWIVDTRVLFYNKTLLRKAGLNPDQPPQYWNELLEAVRRIHNLSGKVYGFGANSAEKHRLYKKFLPFLWGNGGVVLSADGKECLLDSPAAKEALEFYTDLTKYGLIESQLKLDQAFLEGRVGFLISGGWLLQRIREDKPDLEFGVALIPQPKPNFGQPASFAGAEFLVVSKSSKHPAEAMKLIRHLTAGENALRLCRAVGTPSPSYIQAAHDPYYQGDPYLAVFQKQLEYALSSPATPQWVYLEEELEKAVELAMYGKKSPGDALSEAKVAIDRLLKQPEP